MCCVIGKPFSPSIETAFFLTALIDQSQLACATAMVLRYRMFRTLDEHQAGIPGMFGDGLAQWHEVSRLLKTHWYHVTVRGQHEGRATEVSLLVDNESWLQKLLVSQNDDALITDVLVMTPSWMNKGRRWQMEPLSKVTVGEDPYGCGISLIEVESGSVYHTSHSPGFNSNLLTNLRPIFLSSMIRSA